MFKRDRKTNITKILNALWINGGISKVDIARAIDLDKSTVTKIVNELIDINLVRTVKEGVSGPQGGRKPILLTINSNYAYVVGMEIQPEFINICAVDLDGNIVKSKREITNVDIDESNLAEIVTDKLNNFIADFKEPASSVLGVGIGVPGIVNPFSSQIMQSMPIKITQPYNFREKISPRIDYPVIVENDAKCCAWGELALHREKQIKDFLTVLIELGDPGKVKQQLYHNVAVGFGIVIDGKVHYGTDYSSGEFKSLFFTEGNNNQFSLSPEEAESLRTDVKVREKMIRELGIHIALIANMFNLTHLFFGGEAELFREQISTVIPEALYNNWMYARPVHCEIGFLSHGLNSVSLGAAGLILNCIFAETSLKSYEGEALPDGIDLLIKTSPLKRSG